jgi:STE24 endopeptidase
VIDAINFLSGPFLSSLFISSPQSPNINQKSAIYNLKCYNRRMSNTIDPVRQEKAKVYARIQRRLMLVDLGVGAVYLLVWLASGGSLALRRVLQSWTSSAWLLVAVFAIIFGGIYLLIDLPLSYYSDFILPHRFDQSVQTVGGWIKDQLIGLAISGVLGLLLLEAIYWLLRVSPALWWLWAGLLLVFFTVILSNLAPVLIMPLFNKFVPLGEEHAELAERLTRLAARAGTRVQGVFTFDMSKRTKAANAALTGMGNTRRIVLGDTLIQEFTPDEIETVLAHELGHQVHKDIFLGITFASLINLVGLFMAALVLRWGAAAMGAAGPTDPSAMPLFVLVLGAFGLVTMPLTGGWSRWRERLADQYALENTHKPVAFASALARLANQNLAEADPEPWVEFLLYSHPALSKRIKMAEGYTEF